MRLDEFNAATPEQAGGLLRACADVERWVQEILSGRPYANRESLVDAAERAAQPWTEAEIDAALARHPRIGERASGAAADAGMSRREQACLAGAAATTRERIAAGNRAYEERFGHVFLIRAAGRTPQEILDQLQQRLGNTREQERANAAANLREIAVLRLKGSVSS